MPSFLQRARFEVAGNWFPLTNPDDPVVPTARMIWQGQRLMEVREAVTKYCDPKLYRPGEVERVLAKIDRVEKSLPLQTEFVSVPYENAQGGFDLFTPGLSSLAPQLIGHEGIDHFEPDQAASIFLYAENLVLQETVVIAGGRSLDSNQCEILSREVMKITVPAGVMTTLYKADPVNPRVEIHVATPNGISNRLSIPFTPKAAAASSAAKSNFSLGNPPKVVVYVEFNPSGGLAKSKYESSPNLVVKHDPGLPSLNIPTNVSKLAFRLRWKDAFGHAGQLDTADLSRPFPFVSGEAKIPFSAVEPIITTGLEDPAKGLKKSQFSGPLTVEVETAIQVDALPLPIALDNRWTMTIVPRESCCPSPSVPAPASMGNPMFGPAPALTSPEVPDILPLPPISTLTPRTDWVEPRPDDAARSDTLQRTSH